MNDAVVLALLLDVLPVLDIDSPCMGDGELYDLAERTREAIVALDRRVNPPPDPLLRRLREGRS